MLRLRTLTSDSFLSHHGLIQSVDIFSIHFAVGIHQMCIAPLLEAAQECILESGIRLSAWSCCAVQFMPVLLVNFHYPCHLVNVPLIPCSSTGALNICS